MAYHNCISIALLKAYLSDRIQKVDVYDTRSAGFVDSWGSFLFKVYFHILFFIYDLSRPVGGIDTELLQFTDDSFFFYLHFKKAVDIITITFKERRNK